MLKELMMRLVGALGFVLLATFALPAVAYVWSDAEIKAMPGYCQARLGKDAALYEQWSKIIGPGFIHTHHYCHGLGYLNRYYGATSSRTKKGLLQSAYGNFTYMVPRVGQSWPMLPELYLNLGIVLSLQNKDGEALQSMLKAIELDPKLARAYSVTASHYEKLKKKDEALKLVTEGLRQIPDSTSLQRLYVKLGGQLPYPEPAVPQQPPLVEGPTPGVAGEPPAQASSDAVPVAQSVNAEAGVANEESTAAEAETVVPPEIGSPSNPWCRFCPPEPGQ